MVINTILRQYRLNTPLYTCKIKIRKENVNKVLFMKHIQPKFTTESVWGNNNVKEKKSRTIMTQQFWCLNNVYNNNDNTLKATADRLIINSNIKTWDKQSSKPLDSSHLLKFYTKICNRKKTLPFLSHKIHHLIHSSCHLWYCHTVS